MYQEYISIYTYTTTKKRVFTVYIYTYIFTWVIFFGQNLFLEEPPMGTPAIQVAFAQILPVPSIPMAPSWKCKARSEGSENENPGPPPGRWKLELTT